MAAIIGHHVIFFKLQLQRTGIPSKLADLHATQLFLLAATATQKDEPHKRTEEEEEIEPNNFNWIWLDPSLDNVLHG